MRDKKTSGNTTINWQRYLLSIVILAVIWWLLTRRSEVETVARTISHGRWQWIAPAIVAEAGVLLLMTLDYRKAFEAVGLSLPSGDILSAILASQVVGEIAPFGWAAGGAVYLRMAARHGQSQARAAVGILVAQTADLATFSVLFLLGMLTLFLTGHKMSGSEKAGAVVLAAMNSGLIGALALAISWPGLLDRLRRRLQDSHSVFQRAPWLTKLSHAGDGLLKNLVASGAAIREKPKSVLISIAAAGGANLLYVVCLFLTCEAFRQPVTMGELLAGFGVGTLAWIVSPVPGGIGVVEGAMALTFVSLGIPAPQATVIAVAYRGVSFWLPFIAGLFTLRKIGAPTVRQSG